MPLDPKRVQAVYWEAVQYSDPADRAAILDRECMDASELRKRIAALLNAHERFDYFANQPLVGPGRRAPQFSTLSDNQRWATID
jgi:hypothetical protein